MDESIHPDATPVELAGGTVNRPVRIGDTVRRAMGPWSPAVHDLLTYLEAVDFPLSPRFQGIDGEGREVLTYLAGSSIMRPWPATIRSLEGPRSLARAVALYHEAVADYVPKLDLPWVDGRTSCRPGEIVIHGDLGPWNMLIDEDENVVGIIDWDFARPAAAITDVAYLAYYLVMMRHDDVARSAGFKGSPDRRARLATLAAEYGVDPLVLATEGYRLELERFWRIRTAGPLGVEPWAGFLERGMDTEIADELDWLAEHMADLI